MADSDQRDQDVTPPGTARSGEPTRARSKYRDNDDVREPIPPDQRSEARPDSRFEARGDARENIGNTAGGTAANPTDPKGNDKQRRREDEGDDFDSDLADS